MLIAGGEDLKAWIKRCRDNHIGVGYPSVLFLVCIFLVFVFSLFGGELLNLADEIATLQSGETAIVVPIELVSSADELASLLSAWTLASFVIVGFSLSRANGIGVASCLLDQFLGITYVGAAFFSLFFGYSAKAELIELLTYAYPSREAFVEAFRPVKGVIASQAICVCLLGAAAIYLAARGALANIVPRGEP